MKLLLRSLTLGTTLVLLVLILGTWLREVNWALEHGTSYRDSIGFYTGASLVRSGQAAHLYDLDAQRWLQEVLLPVQYRPNLWDFLPFVSPPFVALALAPLAGFSLPTFYVLTGVVNLFLLVVLVVALQRPVTAWPEPWRLALSTLTLMWLPVTWGLLWGQVSILLAVSFILGYLALRSQKDVLAGVVLGALWVKPQYAILILPSLLLWRRRRAAVSFASITMALIVASWTVVGIEGLVAYVELLSRIETMGPKYAMFPASYHTLSGVLLRVFGVSGWPWMLLSGLLAAVALRKVRQGFGPLSFTILILATILVSPHTHLNDLTVLLPAITLGWDAVKQRQVVATTWVYLWFVVGLGLYGLVLNGNVLQDGQLLTVPAMLLASVLVLLHPRIGAMAGARPLAGNDVENP